MNKLCFASFLILCSLLGLAQDKLLVTDFVFFNNFNTPENANVADFFTQSPDGLEQIKSYLTEILQEKYNVTTTSFSNESIAFIEGDNGSNAAKSYSENHKRLIKKGGFTYYLLASSQISPGGPGGKYTFKYQVKLSNNKGKKVMNASLEIPFSSLFRNDQIGVSFLISDTDFFELHKLAMSNIFDEENAKIDAQAFYRSNDAQFAQFIRDAKGYSILDFASHNSVLKDQSGNEIAIRVSGGKESEVNISNARDGLLLMGEKIGPPIVLNVKNPMLKEDWGCYIQAKANSGFEDLDLAPSADILLRIGNQPTNNFRLINGRLTGKLNGKTYLVSFEPSASLLRIFIDQELIALSQPLETGKGKHLKIFYTGAENKFAELINIHQIYFQSIRNLNKSGN